MVAFSAFETGLFLEQHASILLLFLLYLSCAPFISSVISDLEISSIEQFDQANKGKDMFLHKMESAKYTYYRNSSNAIKSHMKRCNTGKINNLEKWIKSWQKITSVFFCNVFGHSPPILKHNTIQCVIQKTKTIQKTPQ